VLCKEAFVERCKTMWCLRYEGSVMPPMVVDVVRVLVEDASMLDVEDGYLAVVEGKRGTWRVQLWVLVDMVRKVASRLDVDVVEEGGPDFEALPGHSVRVQPQQVS